MLTIRRKWALLAGFLVLISGSTVFLLKVVSHSERPAPRQQTNAATAEDPDHELKMLAAELKKKPGHTPVLLRMAQLERERGQIDRAENHLRDVLANEPGSPDALLELGRILYEKGDVSGAIGETKKILAADPKQVDALYNLGAIYANGGDVAHARSYWKQAMQADSASDSGRKAREGLARLGGS